MTVILLDPRQPTLVPVEAVGLLTGAVVYTEEVPIAVAWAAMQAGWIERLSATVFTAGARVSRRSTPAYCSSLPEAASRPKKREA